MNYKVMLPLPSFCDVYPANNYLFKVNNENTKKGVKYVQN